MWGYLKSAADPGISPSQTLIYALPALPLALPTLVLFIYLPTLYVEEFGLDLALVGALLMLARFGDLLLDPWVGTLNDRASARQQRLLMTTGALICAVGLFWLTRPVNNWPGASLLLSLSLLYFGWTLVQIPYLAMLPGLTSSHQSRTRVASLREGLGVVGLLLSAAIPVFLITRGETQLEAMRALTNITIVLVALTLGILVFRLHWPAHRAITSTGKIRTVLRNRPARTLMLAWFSNGLANGIPGVLFPLYVTEVLGSDEAGRAQLILIYFVAAILSLPLWWFASHYCSRKRLWQGAMLVAVIAFLPAAMLGSGDFSWFLIICLATGAMLGADLALPQALQADVCDWHRIRYGRDQSGLLFALWNVCTKLALALAALLAFGLLDLSGFNQSEGEAGALALIYAFLPCVFKLIAVTLMQRFSLTEATHQRIVARLNNRR